MCGPAVIHTGGGPAVARLVRDGWIDVLFAGNGFATHDMESNVLGTSLGISVTSGHGTEGGHSNHLRLINTVRRHGSIAAAVDAGFVGSGVMYECVQRGVPFVLGGSVRDDGPLPDTIADVVVAADTMREHIAGVGVALMLASTLHAIATGNILPGGVETFCVDINQAVVTKLADRGSHQALGIVTDVGPFCHDLADALQAPDGGYRPASHPAEVNRARDERFDQLAVPGRRHPLHRRQHRRRRVGQRLRRLLAVGHPRRHARAERQQRHERHRPGRHLRPPGRLPRRHISRRAYDIALVVVDQVDGRTLDSQTVPYEHDAGGGGGGAWWRCRPGDAHARRQRARACSRTATSCSRSSTAATTRGAPATWRGG